MTHTTQRSVLEPRLDTEEGFALLRTEVAAHKTAVTDGGILDRLPIAAIRRMISVFQPRSLSGNLADDAKHIDDLAKIVGKPPAVAFLDPVTVWWSGLAFYVLDGHHRIAAYRQQGYDGEIPVEVFHGTLDEAMLRSRSDNTKNRLAVTEDDKCDSALKAVLMTDCSKSAIAKACGVGTALIGRQRQAIVKVLADNPEMSRGELADLGWKEVNRMAKGEEPSPYDGPDYLEVQASKHATRMLRAMGQPFFQNVELVARTLSVLGRDMPKRLMETIEWSRIRQGIPYDDELDY